MIRPRWSLLFWLERHWPWVTKRRMEKTIVDIRKQAQLHAEYEIASTKKQLETLIDRLTLVLTERPAAPGEPVSITMAVDARLFYDSDPETRRLLAREVGDYMAHHFSRLIVLRKRNF